MKLFVVSLVSLIAGIGGGYALSPATWAAVAAIGARSAEVQPEIVTTEPALIDVVSLLPEVDQWGPAARIKLAIELDSRFVENGQETRVRAGGPDNVALVIVGGFGRVGTLELAKQFDFEALQRAGFELFVTQGISDQFTGYIVSRALSEGLRAPLDHDVLMEFAKSLQE